MASSMQNFNIKWYASTSKLDVDVDGAELL